MRLSLMTIILAILAMSPIYGLFSRDNYRCTGIVAGGLEMVTFHDSEDLKDADALKMCRTKLDEKFNKNVMLKPYSLKPYLVSLDKKDKNGVWTVRTSRAETTPVK